MWVVPKGVKAVQCVSGVPYYYIGTVVALGRHLFLSLSLSLSLSVRKYLEREDKDMEGRKGSIEDK